MNQIQSVSQVTEDLNFCLSNDWKEGYSRSQGAWLLTSARELLSNEALVAFLRSGLSGLTDHI